MTQEQIEFSQKLSFKAKQKGWFIAFLITKVLPFLIENWDDLFPKKAKLSVPKTMEAELCGGLPKPNYNQTPNGYWSCSNSSWVWIDDLGLGG